MTFAVCFTNFGPYHLARLRALASALAKRGDHLIAYEVAGAEERYPWARSSGGEAFTWTTFFPNRPVEGLSGADCARAMERALDRDRPDALGIVGYARPECMSALRWARRHERPTVLMSESQEIDHPRTWWKEAIKRRRVRAFSAGLVGGPRHRDYLVKLGLPADRIALGYNAVDNAHYARIAAEARSDPGSRRGLPDRPYFLAVNRFVPEKNLSALVDAYATYRASSETRWDLVLCGDGQEAGALKAQVGRLGLSDSVQFPGFLQAGDVARWLAHASAFVHPSRMEPWGLVVNEAAACGLPLLVSDRAGCVETLVPDPPGTTGRRLDPDSVGQMAEALAWMAGLPESERLAMAGRSAGVVSEWGPERFASGTIEALELAARARIDRRVHLRHAAAHAHEPARPRKVRSTA